jgi:hypothetical protein
MQLAAGLERDDFVSVFPAAGLASREGREATPLSCHRRHKTGKGFGAPADMIDSFSASPHAIASYA